MAFLYAHAHTRARVLAADFTAPYDPDFAQPAPERAPSKPPKAQEPKAVEIPLPEPGQEGPAPAVIMSPNAKPLLLLDRTDPSRIFEVAPSTTAEKERDFSDFQKGLKPFQYDQKKYNAAREKIEMGLEPGTEPGQDQPLGPFVYTSTETAPKPPPPELELPTYGTSLSVTGRKVIGFNFSEKRFLNDQSKTGRPATTNLIEIEQQLQLRMQGKVGPKITVNVDYDDTKANHQDISVVYTGDPNEVVQNVSFGDIDLSLPATEFVSYNKQLFGIRADIKYKGFKATFIGSRTKGTTKSKQFNGNTQFVSVDFADTSYVRRQYYDLTFGMAARLPLRAGTERVFLARQVPGQVNVNDITLTVDDLQDQNLATPAIDASSFTGTFTQLNPGIDYTIDYAKGIINFRTPLLAQYVIAIDFVDASGINLSVQRDSDTFTGGGSGLFKIIKTAADVPIACSSCTFETGFNREMKTFYNIGQQQIVRDNGRGNFILRVIDQQRNEVGTTLNPVQKYPDTINVDFENGSFQLLQPFSVSNSSPSTPDPDVYAQTPISKRLIHVEYSFRFKTFFLEPNLVPQSEVVLLDNLKLNRNVDYFIDYDAGFITFFNENRIGAQSSIDISYEVAPFVGATNESLLGTRVSYDFNSHYSVGTTLLYQAGAKSPTVPSITELARSLLVYEFDAQMKDIKLTRKLRMINLGTELAQSRQNLNLNPAALIDNMEGVRQEDAASTLSQQWFIATNPQNPPGLSGGAASVPNKISWFSEDVKVLEINPRAQASANESQKVLNLDYSGLANSERVSLVFPFSISGIDLSQRTILEVTMLGDLTLNDINFRLGGVGEDADADGVFDTEDTNRDGILQSAEDVGWQYDVAPTARFGANNGKVDTEDLNANGRLDTDDGNGNNFGFGGDITGTGLNTTQLRDVNGVNHTNLDFGGGTNWLTFQIPLQISTATLSRWTNIKNLRITIRRPAAGGQAAGTVKFARVAVVGNTWQRGIASDPSTNSTAVNAEQIIVTPVNSVDNPNYTPIFNAGGDATSVFNDLYGSLSNLQKQSNTKNISEQALQIEYSGMTISGTGQQAVVTTKRLFSRPIDVSQHKFFSFLVYGNAGTVNNTDHTFFLRSGNDTNFFEARVPLNFTGWKRVSVLQADTNGDSVADTWKVDTSGVVIVSSGAPSLQQVASLVAGVRRTASVTAGADATPTDGRVFLNEIHVTQPITRVGTAKKIEAAFEYAGWGTFGGKYREVDRNFQTPTSVVSNQDNRLDSAYLNLTRISFFPMNFTLQRVITNTPNTAQTGDLSNLVNLLQQGRVTNWTGTAQGNFSLGAYPRMAFGHTRSRIEYETLTRLDDRRTYNGSLQYGVPLNSRFLPKTVDASWTRSNYDVTFQRADVLEVPGNFNTFETGNTYAMRLTFIPWSGSSFNPSYSLTKVKERRDDYSGLAPDRHLEYPKSMNQSAGFSSNFRLNRWLNPQVNYTIDLIENNILNVSTFVVRNSTVVYNVGDIKTVNRSANGSISLPLTIGEIFPRSRLFRSMNIVNGYQIQDGDVWNQVEKELNTMGALWVRTPLRPGTLAAVRANMTLRDTLNSTQRWSPLEAYDIRGRKASFKTLSLSNNFVKTIQRNEVTGTPSKTISTTFPDIVASLSQMEQLFFSERWMSNAQMTYKYTIRKSETIGETRQYERAFGTDLRTIIRKRFETLLQYNMRDTQNTDLRVDANTQKTAHKDATAQVTFDVGKFRFTPKTDYTNDVTTLGTGVKTQDLTVITPSLLIRADLALPRGLLLPGSTKTILFSNRIIWTTTLSLAERKSPVTQADNSRLFQLNTSGDYEIAKNLRMTLNGAMSRLWHKFLKEEDYISYQFGTTLTFQF